MKRATIDFNMLVEINQLLKSNNMDYSLHAIGGCSCCGVELRQDGKEREINVVIDFINDYLKNKWMRIIKDSGDTNTFGVFSLFE